MKIIFTILPFMKIIVKKSGRLELAFLDNGDYNSIIVLNTVGFTLMNKEMHHDHDQT